MCACDEILRASRRLLPLHTTHTHSTHGRAVGVVRGGSPTDDDYHHRPRAIAGGILRTLKMTSIFGSARDDIFFHLTSRQRVKECYEGSFKSLGGIFSKFNWKCLIDALIPSIELHRPIRWEWRCPLTKSAHRFRCIRTSALFQTRAMSHRAHLLGGGTSPLTKEAKTKKIPPPLALQNHACVERISGIFLLYPHCN